MDPRPPAEVPRFLHATAKKETKGIWLEMETDSLLRRECRVAVAHTFNPSTGEAEAWISVSLRPAWFTEFQHSQCYTVKPCHEKPKKEKRGGRGGGKYYKNGSEQVRENSTVLGH